MCVYDGGCPETVHGDWRRHCLRTYVAVFWIRDWTCFVRMLCMMDYRCLSCVVRMYALSHANPISAHHPLPNYTWMPSLQRTCLCFLLCISSIDLLPYAFYRCLYELRLVHDTQAFPVWHSCYSFSRQLVLTHCIVPIFLFPNCIIPMPAFRAVLRPFERYCTHTTILGLLTRASHCVGAACAPCESKWDCERKLI